MVMFTHKPPEPKAQTIEGAIVTEEDSNPVPSQLILVTLVF